MPGYDRRFAFRAERGAMTCSQPMTRSRRSTWATSSPGPASISSPPLPRPAEGIHWARVRYANGSVGFCECGQMAVASCARCNKPICAVHANELPVTPSGISPDAAGHFAVAIRMTHGPHCESCRAEIGQYALLEALNAPRTPLPGHWLDRAIVLSSDSSRSDLEKAEDVQLPASLTATDVAQEFLRRIEKQPQERVPISPSTFLRAPEYVEGWTVDCRRTEYVAVGAGAVRYRLPCLISVHGELLGPLLEDGERQSATWWLVPESDIELPRLVSSVANILMLSAFVTQTPDFG